LIRPTSPSKNNLPPVDKENPAGPKDTSVAPGDEPRKFDSTGMFHWCPARPMDDALMVRNISLISKYACLLM